MFRTFFLLIVLFLGAAVQAHAQSGDEDCPTAPTDLLAGLDGTWSVQQGAGVMIVPVMGAMPLPAHAPLRLTMAHDPATGTSQLTGSGPDEQLIMIATHESLVPQIRELVSAADKEDLLNTGEGCDWHALPLMVGTRTYSLDAPASSETGTVIALALPEGSPESAPMFAPVACLTSRDKQGIVDFLGERSQAAFGSLGRIASSGKLYVQHDADCNASPASSGDMTMTLLVKFQTPSSGTGMVIFEVNQNGTPAIAKAPVTMSR